MLRYVSEPKIKSMSFATHEKFFMFGDVKGHRL